MTPRSSLTSLKRCLFKAKYISILNILIDHCFSFVIHKTIFCVLPRNLGLKDLFG